MVSKMLRLNEIARKQSPAELCYVKAIWMVIGGPTEEIFKSHGVGEECEILLFLLFTYNVMFQQSIHFGLVIKFP
jgi:hypothetical protein